MNFRHPIIYHVYLGKSENHAWCGRYGSHSLLYARREEELLEDLGNNHGARYCKACLRCIRADKAHESVTLRAAITGYYRRRNRLMPPVGPSLDDPSRDDAEAAALIAAVGDPVWQPLKRVAIGPDLGHLREPVHELWSNNEYEVFVRYISGERSGPLHLSIKRVDREPVTDWRHKQALKNEVAGPEREAIELFPAESRLVDAANQTHLWCVSEGITIEVGYAERLVGKQEDMYDLAVAYGYDPTMLGNARQRPWQPGIPTGPST